MCRLINTLVLLGTVFLIQSASAQSVTLYEFINFKGESTSLPLGGGCSNIPANWNKVFGSIDGQGKCVYLFQNSGCSGLSLRVEPDSQCAARLPECTRNTVLKAFRAC